MLFGEPVFAEMVTENRAGVHRHGTVEIDRDLRQSALLPQLTEMVEERLRAPDREGRNDDRPAAPDRSSDNVFEYTFRIGLSMMPIAVCGLGDDVIGLGNRHGIDHRRAAVASDVTREDNLHIAALQLDTRCAENMAHRPEDRLAIMRNFDWLFERHRFEGLQRGFRVGLGVKGPR